MTIHEYTDDGIDKYINGAVSKELANNIDSEIQRYIDITDSKLSLEEYYDKYYYNKDRKYNIFSTCAIIFIILNIIFSIIYFISK